MRRIIWLCLWALCACTLGYNTGGIQQVSGQVSEDPERAEEIFFQVLTDMRPVAVRECLNRRQDRLCEFVVIVDLDPRSPPNAFQSQTDDGQPILTVTASMIASFQNSDELAFVMAHEVSHHILQHLERQNEAIEASAELYARREAERGGSSDDIRRAQQIGARIGAQTMSRDFELEADRLGTVITAQSGYDPRIGARYFQRLPEPGDSFLSTHPANATRQQLVEQTAREFGL